MISNFSKTQILLWAHILMCVAFLVWAAVFPLSIFSIADGEVVPSSRVKQVQHLEGGIILNILVKEGQIVELNQPLVELETTSSGADVAQLQQKLGALNIDRVRMLAEINDDIKLDFPEDLVARFPELTIEAQNLFESRQNLLKNKISSFEEIIRQKQADLKQAESALRNLRDEQKLIQEQITISKDLIASGLADRYEHINLLRKSTEVQGLIDQNSAALQRATAKLKEAEFSKQRATNIRNEENLKELENGKRVSQGITEQLIKAEDSFMRSVLRAPVAGTIKTLRYATKGGVVPPGGTVLDIVPGADTLVIEAKLSPGDIGYVQVGDDVRISLASIDAARFGNLKGKVELISPDTLVTTDGRVFYAVRIRTEENFFKTGSEKYHLYPGVIVVAKILVGTRTVLEYLLTPFLGGMSSALSER